MHCESLDIDFYDSNIEGKKVQKNIFHLIKNSKTYAIPTVYNYNVSLYITDKN